jgi:uncharacterized protein (TIGR02679 family)
MTDDTRLRSVLGGPDVAWLVQRLRRRLEAGGSAEGTLTLQSPGESQREAIGRLFGRRTTSSSSLTVSLSELDALLRRANLADGIVDAMTQLCGPIVDLGGQHRDVEAQWAQVFEAARHCMGARPPVLAWLDDVRSTGLLRRLARGDAKAGKALLEQSLSVAARLPAMGISLAELAATATGDSHALDLGQPVGTLVMRLAAALGGTIPAPDSQSRRDSWANVGVLCDELSAPVLALNLRAAGSASIAQVLMMHADAGEPYRLSTRQLLRHPPDFSPAISGQTVYICENPSVVACAANQLGARSAPLICVDGQLKTAARLLLTRLAAAGARLMYHGDFDWGGIRIANVVIAHCGAVPWRYSSRDYRAAPPGVAMRGPSVAASWDSELEAAMLASSRAVHEEQVLCELLADLAQDTATR